MQEKTTKPASREVPNVDGPWLRAEGAAAYLGLAVGSVRNMAWSKRLPCCKRGRVVRFHRDDLDRWLRGEL
jgi:excisionase family DNA binding protein